MSDPSGPTFSTPYWLRAFRQANYRLFFTGQIMALNGMWMSMAAMGWLIFRLTEDPFMLGLMAFFLQAPTFLLSSIGGVLADQWDRRKLILIVQATNAMAIGWLGVVTLTGAVTVTHILVICMVLGTTKAVEMPTRQALVADITKDKADLPNVIALNSSIFHSARLTGPLVAGVLIIPFLGEEGCFFAHSLAYVGGIFCFSRLRLIKKKKLPEGTTFLSRLAEGYRYTFGYPPIRDAVLFMAAIALIGMPYNTLLPVFADTVLDGDSSTYGLLIAAGGLGALFAGTHLAMRKSVLGMGRVIGGNIVLFGLMLFGFSLSTNLFLSLAFLFLSGFSSIMAIVGANTIVQTLVDDHMRGRVMSLFGMVFMGALPLGALFFGQAARLYGAPVVVASAAVGTVLVGIVFLLRLPSLRRLAKPVYQERGILPKEIDS
ncbi:MAG: MFS transporter [Opitutales bacterium]|nr:MFS transporter [Opitutales bacterium]MCH8540187.1 MFS transporter [Opitutales bacterium]